MRLLYARLAVELIGTRLLAAVASVGLVAGWRTAGLVAAAAVAVTAWAAHRRLIASGGLEYALVVLGLVAARWTETGPSVWLVAVGVAGLVLFGDELVLRKVGEKADGPVSAANLPGLVGGRRFGQVPAGLANPGLTVALGLAVGFSLPIGFLVAAVGLAASVHGACVIEALAQLRSGGGASQRLGAALTAHRPAFLLYFSAPAGSEYQATMWLPYLERTGVPFAVVLRERYNLAAIVAATKAPVLVCPGIGQLDQLTVPSVRAVFYVNNGMKNTHMVRFQRPTHVQLLHGDSEKPPSFNPVTAMYDRVFVAGQAGIDRYADHGVSIAADKFRIVGRPQVETIKVAADRVGDLAEKVVLYAPTWTGHYSDANLCSLPIAARLVDRLLEHKTTVIFRPHPYSMKDPASARQIAAVHEVLDADRRLTGRNHVWGATASSGRSLVDCFNAADALITDVSSVANDFLFAEKPMAIVEMTDAPAEALEDVMPLARAAYLIRADLDGVDETFDRLLNTDPKQDARRVAKGHYLGPFPAKRYAQAFIQAVRDEIGTCSSPVPITAARQSISASDDAVAAGTAAPYAVA